MTVISSVQFRRPSSRGIASRGAGGLASSGAAIGKELEGLGRQFDRMAEAEANRRKEEIQLSQASTADTLTHAAFPTFEQMRADLQAEAPPGGEGHAQQVATRSEELVKESVERFLEAHAGEPGVQERALRLRSRLGDIALGSYRQADAFERAEGQRYRLETAGRVAAAYGKRAIENPEAAEAFYQFGLDSIAEQDLPAVVKDGLTQGYRRAFAERFLGVLMQEAPEKVGEAARSELFAGALSPEEIDRLDEQAKLEKGWQEDARRLAQARADRESRERATVERALRLDALEQALETGEADTPDIDRLRQVDGLNQAELGRLKSIARQWKDRQERRVRNIEAITEILNSGGLAGSAQPADREAVEDYYQRWSTSPSLADASPEERNAALARFVGRVGRLPKALEDSVRDQLDGSPENQALASDLLHRFEGLPQDFPIPISPRTLARARLMRRFQTLGKDPATAAKMAQEATQPGDAERDTQRAAEAADLPPITAEEIIEASEHTLVGRIIDPLSDEEKAAQSRELVHLPLTPEEKAAIERFVAELQEHEYRLTGDETTARDTAIKKAVSAGMFDGSKNDQGSAPIIPTKRPYDTPVEEELPPRPAPTADIPPIPTKRPTVEDVVEQNGSLLEQAQRTGVINELSELETERGLTTRIAQAKRANEVFGRDDVVPFTSAELEELGNSLMSLDAERSLEKIDELATALPPLMFAQVAQRLGRENSPIGFAAILKLTGAENSQIDETVTNILAGTKFLKNSPLEGNAAIDPNRMLLERFGLNYDDIPDANKPLVEAAMAHFIGSKVRTGWIANLGDVNSTYWSHFDRSVDMLLQTTGAPDAEHSVRSLKAKLTEPIEDKAKRILLDAVPEVSRTEMEQFYDKFLEDPPRTESDRNEFVQSAVSIVKKYGWVAREGIGMSLQFYGGYLITGGLMTGGTSALVGMAMYLAGTAIHKIELQQLITE